MNVLLARVGMKQFPTRHQLIPCRLMIADVSEFKSWQHNANIIIETARHIKPNPAEFLYKQTDLPFGETDVHINPVKFICAECLSTGANQRETANALAIFADFVQFADKVLGAKDHIVLSMSDDAFIFLSNFAHTDHSAVHIVTNGRHTHFRIEDRDGKFLTTNGIPVDTIENPKPANISKESILINWLRHV